MCSTFSLLDVTPLTSRGSADGVRIASPVAEAVFARGQTPVRATPGDVVENDLDGAIATVSDGWNVRVRPWSLVILDLCFLTGTVTPESHTLRPGVPPGRPSDRQTDNYFGLRILREIQRRFPDLPVAIISGHNKDEVSREYTKAGAVAFLHVDQDDGPAKLRELLDVHALMPDASGRIIGESRELLVALRAARRVARVDRNVLLRGERGTGKELFARLIHDARATKPNRAYETLDCGSIQPNLFSSELFGHERGAFTGADRRHEGIIARARGGDLFLDEIGNLPADVQIGLLRAIELRTIVPLGSRSPQAVDVRFIAATNEDLERACADGKFRADLLDRLSEAGTIQLPALRDRRDDLPILIDHFVRQAEAVVPNAAMRRIDPETILKLSSYDWPGNIRELRSCLLSAVLDFPAVEHLMPSHVHLNDAGQRLRESAASMQSATLEQVPVATFEPRELSGLLPRIEVQYLISALQALRAALDTTKRVTVDNPGGELLIQPAVRLLSGNRTLTASQAADVIKRLFRQTRGVPKALIDDPVLKEALQIARRLRPSAPKMNSVSTEE